MASKGKAIAILVGVGAGLLLLSRKASAAPRRKTEMLLGKYFRLSEFLNSGIFPDLAFYEPSATELAHVKTLVSDVLDPARDSFGPIKITNGGRPASVAKRHNTTWYEALKKAGYFPALVSDHDDFSAADIVPQNISQPSQWIDVWAHLRENPNTRQVILSAHTDHNGNVVLDHIHVAVIVTGKNRYDAKDFAFIELDGKRVESLPEKRIA